MIFRNKRDTESFLRENTIQSLQENKYVEVGDIILVAETESFYTINENEGILLNNQLYALKKIDNILTIIEVEEIIKKLRGN
ncbi:MAG: hypothetical protein RR795_02720 [Cetobacterium sp.]|uniref:hypothetical protein n=1 Tax=Cetobacterium sp. TaxID=2071632 RepID=UPI002FCC6969